MYSMKSIKEEAIETFELAAQLISWRWKDELFSQHDKVKFCAYDSKGILKIGLNSDWTKKSNDVFLQRTLETFGEWATAHASQEQKHR